MVGPAGDIINTTGVPPCGVVALATFALAVYSAHRHRSSRVLARGARGLADRQCSFLSVGRCKIRAETTSKLRLL